MILILLTPLISATDTTIIQSDSNEITFEEIYHDDPFTSEIETTTTYERFTTTYDRATQFPKYMKNAQNIIVHEWFYNNNLLTQEKTYAEDETTTNIELFAITHYYYDTQNRVNTLTISWPETSETASMQLDYDVNPEIPEIMYITGLMEMQGQTFEPNSQAYIFETLNEFPENYYGREERDYFEGDLFDRRLREIRWYEGNPEVFLGKVTYTYTLGGNEETITQYNSNHQITDTRSYSYITCPDGDERLTSAIIDGLIYTAMYQDSNLCNPYNEILDLVHEKESKYWLHYFLPW